MTEDESVKSRWNEIEAVFAEAIDLSEPARAAFLDARLAGRSDVRREVESLLAANARASSFMRDPTHRADESASPTLGEGDQVGAFRLVERIASGGMGTVYRADRVEGGFTQQVAVKVIAAPMTHEVMARRFRAERQILASLQHPNIVTLIDGGVTPHGDAYLVMEYVDGSPITAYCRDHKLDLAARLRLFRQVADAVQYAHAHFVVHRDLKPANVLVTNDGVPKVLDFGVARLVDPLTTTADETDRGVGPMTPNYASPEQLRGLPLTTATDIYSLGVLLFELLTGTRPYETTGKPLDAVMKLVVDTEPTRPSTAEPAPDVRPPYEWRRVLRGDLDAIAIRALQKNPAERYASADAFSKDVGRYLSGEPVEAREPSFTYVLRKLAARHRVAFASAGLAVTLVMATSAAALWEARVANVERARAGRRFNDVRQLAHALIFDVHDAVEPLAGSTPVRERIVREGLTYLERLAPESSGDPDLQVELGRAYVKIGSVQGRPNIPNLGDRAGAIASFRKARALLAPTATLANAPAPIFASYLDAMRFLSETLGATGTQRDEAITIATEGAAAAAKFAGEHPGVPEGRSFVAVTEFQLAIAVGPERSLPHWQKAGAAYDALLAERPDDPVRQRNAALVEKYLGSYYEDKRDYAAALEHHKRALDLDQARLDRSPATRTTQLDVAIDLGNVAYIHWTRHELPETIAGYKRSLEMREQLLASDPKDVMAQSKVAYVQGVLGAALAAHGEEAAALPYLRAAVDAFDTGRFTSPKERASAANAFVKIGEIEQQAGHVVAGCQALRRAFGIYRDLSETDLRMFSDSENMAFARQSLGRCGASQGPEER